MLSPEQIRTLGEWFLYSAENPGEPLPDSLTEMGDLLETDEDSLIELYESLRFGSAFDEE